MDILDEGRIGDETGHHHGTCLGSGCPTLTTGGSIEGAYEFDGGDDVVRVPASPEFEFTNGFAVAAWIQRAANGDDPCFISQRFGAQGDAWQICSSPNDLVVFYSRGTTEGNNDDYLYARQPSPGSWFHITISWDGLKKRIYLFGILQNEIEHPIFLDSSSITIGGVIDGGQPRLLFAGLMDDVRIYNRALSEEEINDLIRH
jgi:hypothetical protein